MFHFEIKVACIKFYMLYKDSKKSKTRVKDIKSIFGVANSTFYMWLRQYKKKKFELKSTKNEKKKLKQELFKKIKDISKDDIISIDETAIYLNCKLDHGWSVQGKDCIVIDKNPNIRSKKYSLITAISNNKIVAYKLYEKSVNGTKFLDFIKSIENVKDYWILMDNVRIHKTKMFNNYAKEQGLKIIYNIPYNPET